MHALAAQESRGLVVRRDTYAGITVMNATLVVYAGPYRKNDGILEAARL